MITIADVIAGVPAGDHESWFRGAVQAYTEGSGSALRSSAPLSGRLTAHEAGPQRKRHRDFTKMACHGVPRGEFSRLTTPDYAGGEDHDLRKLRS